MSARRKNSRRLRDLRAIGFPIDGHYRVPDTFLRACDRDVFDLIGKITEGRDAMRCMTRIGWRGQQVLLGRRTA